jgi:hypothetical protein
MWDQPGGLGPVNRDKTFWLKRMEKVLFFQTWLVAIKQGDFSSVTSPLDRIRRDFIPEIIRASHVNVVPFAHIPPFGMTFRAQADLATFHPRLSFDTPNYSWGLASVDGFFPTTKINTATGVTAIARVAKAAAGNGGRDPVVTRPTANQAAKSWLHSQGLD